LLALFVYLFIVRSQLIVEMYIVLWSFFLVGQMSLYQKLPSITEAVFRVCSSC